MARSTELTPAIRERICELHAIQWGYKRIQKRYPYIPLSTIRYTIKKEHERQEGVSKARSGRPKKLSEAEKDRILESIHGNPRITQEDLLASVDHKVKIRSIQRLLNAENLRKWRCSWRPYLTEENAIKRLRWAYRYRHFTPEDWARVFWSDECMLNEELVSAESGLLLAQKINQKRVKSKDCLNVENKLNRCFGQHFQELSGVLD